MDFKDVIGQEPLKRQLIADTLQHKVPHALLLCGGEGHGAMPLALAFAQYLLCQEREPKAESGGLFGEAAPPAQPLDHSCGHCRSCIMAAELQHPDLHFAFPIYKKQSKPTVSDDFLTEWRQLLLANPYFGYQEWMEACGAENQQLTIYVEESDAIQRKLSIVSSQGGYKVCIIWLPEKMNEACANKMLKLLEEPPAATVFLLVSQQPDHILPTIRSRAQRIDVPPLPEADLADALIRLHSVEPAHARRIAHTVSGNLTAALREITRSGDESEELELFISLMRLAYARKVKEMKVWSEQVAALGRERQKHLLEYFQRLVRENFMHNFRQPSLVYMSTEEEQFATRFAPFINERNVIGIMEEIALAQRDVAQNANPKMLFFDFALKMIVLIKNR